MLIFRIWRALLLACFLLIALGGRQAGAQQLPRYDLDIHFDLEAGRLTGHALIEIPESAVDDGAVRLNVSLPGDAAMDILRITGSSGRVLEHSVAETTGILEVQLEGSSATVDIDYGFPVDRTGLDPFGYYVFADFGSSPLGYPEVVQPGGQPYRFADFRVSFEHPASLAVLSTGGEGERRQEGDRIVARYEAVHVEGFAIVAGEGFVLERHEEDGVAVVAFYHPDHADKFARVIQRTAEAAVWYRRTYGFFPLEQIGIIQGHPRWGGGYPLPNLFAIHLGNLEDDFLTFITAHELGHYYWGLYVLGDEERLDWLQLALGIWSDQLYLAEHNGLSLPEQWRRAGHQGDWITDYLEAVVADREQRLGLLEEQEQTLGFDYNSLIRHGKAATGLYLQSLLIGPERFLDLQRHLLQAYRHRPLPESEFTALLVDAGADGAAEFFEAWKRGDAIIGLAVDSVEPDTESGAWRITVRRTGPVPYPIEIEAASAEGETARHTIGADVKRDTMHVAFSPAAIRLDPEGSIPMWNTSHPEMRSVFARALERARLDESFVILAQAVLDEIPEDAYLRYRLVRRLFWLARWREAAAQWPSMRTCDCRDACLTAIYSARALARMGLEAEAIARLDALHEKAEQYDVLAFWNTVRDEASR